MATLSACGGSSEGDGGKDTGGTRTVTGTFTGDVTGVPKNPKRVVGLWRTGTELAELGVVPVATLQGEFLEDELGPQLYSKVKDVPTVGSFQGVDIEKVIKAKPDLIVGMDNGGLSIDYKELQDIAPTVIFKIAEPPDVWTNYPKLADVLGKTTDWSQRNAALDKSLAAIRTEHGAKVSGLKAVSLGVNSAKTYVDTSKSLNYQRLNAAGFGYLGAYTANPARYRAELPSEKLPDLSDADVIFYDATIDGKPSPGTEKLLDTASFKRLPAVKAGNVFPLTMGTVFTFDAADKAVADIRKAAESAKDVRR
ncbi:ABC transporter substrate-binding protein [Actinomadura atramentaria]|uniref:ABC transporter substrate-binding protein n=1 Tax=Actinomadura atramentaria TaxID=1990 RepID=UPI001F0A5446|nr:ABC transporter substrate-binding protein [Actinomadura atramentaria]